MRIAILGSGAMGSVFGGHLALAGHDVTLVDVRRDHIEAVRRNGGLEMRRPGGESERIRLGATAEPETLEPVDLVIVLTKAFATEEAARSIRHAVTPQTWVVTVQNGLGNDRRLAAVFGPDRVVPGTTTVGAKQDRPGVTTMSVSTAERQTTTHLGPPSGAAETPEKVRDIARTLTEAGLPAEALDSADVVIWTKVALAAPMGSLSAVLRRTVEDVYANEHSRAVLRAMFDEIVSVAEATGVKLDRDSVWEHSVRTYRTVGPHVTSMAADVLAGRATEIDALCLEIARLGEDSGVSTPVNWTIGQMVKAIEQTYNRAVEAAG